MDTSRLLALTAWLLTLAACQPTPPAVQEPDNQAQPEQTDPQPAPQATPVSRAITRYSAAAFFDNERVFGSAINFDGSAVLVTSDKTGIDNVFRYPLNGDAPVQLTFSNTDAFRGVSWFPRDERFLYQADEGGNELTHIYAQHPNGEIHDLTPGKELKARFLGWDQDDEHFYLATNERDARVFDVYRYRNDTYLRSRIFTNQRAWSVGRISPNGRYLALLDTRSNIDNDVLMADLSYPGGRVFAVSAGGDPANNEIFTFTPDSRALIYGSNAGREYTRALQYDIESDTTTEAYAADWDVTGFYYSANGRYRVVTVNADASTRITITDTRQQLPVSIPALAQGNLSGVNFTDSEEALVFYLESDVTPANLYSYRIGGEVRRLTNTLNPEMQARDLVSSTVVRFPSFDGLDIPALLYRPHQASAAAPVPALVWIHGGPGGQSRKGYEPVIQHLVNHGYAVIAVNNRGSAGYGKSFYHLDDQRHGEDDLNDIVFAKRYLETLPWVNPNAIGVMGASYGGFLTMAAMTFSDEFAAGINIFGVTNWIRTLESIPPWWESFRTYLYDELGDPATDRERLYRISPLFHADQISKPIMVVQGANDPRVLKRESDDLVAAIQASNVPVEYILFADEGHGFRTKANRIIAQQAYLRFLDNYLKTDTD